MEIASSGGLLPERCLTGFQGSVKAQFLQTPLGILALDEGIDGLTELLEVDEDATVDGLFLGRRILLRGSCHPWRLGSGIPPAFPAGAGSAGTTDLTAPLPRHPGRECRDPDSRDGTRRPARSE